MLTRSNKHLMGAKTLKALITARQTLSPFTSIHFKNKESGWLQTKAISLYFLSIFCSLSVDYNLGSGYKYGKLKVNNSSWYTRAATNNPSQLETGWQDAGRPTGRGIVM